jgi:hypothetical protein
MDKLHEAYMNRQYDDFDQIKKQINQLKSIMNSQEMITSANQIFEQQDSFSIVKLYS